MLELEEIEERILGCLLEKERTTPDHYPLSLNSLRLACNQSTNRTPVVAYEEPELHAAVLRMRERELVRKSGGYSNRTAKYRHLLEERIGLAPDEVAVLCVLLLRGAQTPGELKQRTERMHSFNTLADLGDTLDDLARRDLVRPLPHRPGEKQTRYVHLAGADGGVDAQRDGGDRSGGDRAGGGRSADAGGVDGGAVRVEPAAGSETADRIDALAASVESLSAEVAELRRRLDAIAPE